MSMTEKDLFTRLVTLETEKLTLMDDIKQLKADAKYDEDLNPKGIAKEDVALVGKAAVLEAKNKFEEQKQAADAVFDKYRELTGYDS